MNKAVVFELVPFGWPPSVNDYYGKRVIGKGSKAFVSVYLTAKAKKFNEQVALTVLAMELDKKLTHRLSMRAVFHAPTKRKYDISNYIKLLEDSLEAAGVYLNDNQIDHWELVRGDVRPGNGLVEVSCYIIPE